MRSEIFCSSLNCLYPIRDFYSRTLLLECLGVAVLFCKHLVSRTMVGILDVAGLFMEMVLIPPFF